MGLKSSTLEEQNDALRQKVEELQKQLELAVAFLPQGRYVMHIKATSGTMMVIDEFVAVETIDDMWTHCNFVRHDRIIPPFDKMLDEAIDHLKNRTDKHEYVVVKNVKIKGVEDPVSLSIQYMDTEDI